MVPPGNGRVHGRGDDARGTGPDQAPVICKAPSERADFMTAFATYSSEDAARRAVAVLRGNGPAQDVRLLIAWSVTASTNPQANNGFRATAGSYRGRPPPGRSRTVGAHGPSAHHLASCYPREEQRRDRARLEAGGMLAVDRHRARPAHTAAQSRDDCAASQNEADQASQPQQQACGPETTHGGRPTPPSRQSTVAGL
jgi:hypothetical protein